MNKQFIVRCKFTGVYHINQWAPHHGFVTMDEKKAQRYVDTPELREKFLKAYPYELEFISV